MKRKSTKVSRLSPNEEEKLIREEVQRRRKLRLQQVREQERYIALQVRREVQERRERELQSLATTLRDEWQKQRGERIQTLEKLYKENLQDVGQGHRSAKQNEPNREALALKKEQDDTRAAERHQKALQNLITQRQVEAEQRNRHVDARKKALMVEKERAAKIASLPHSAPDPIESVAIQIPLQPKVSKVEHYSVTHHHIPETAVDRETDTVQSDAQEAAALEARRLEELEKDEVRDRQEQLERARLRGDHALRKEKGIQNNARLLCELERLQQAEMQRRRHVVNSMPAQIFQPLYRRDDMRAEQQRDLEIAFQDLCTEDKEIRDDLGLQSVSEPLPPPVPSSKTDSRHECDLDLDVTLEPKETPCEKDDEDASQSQSMRSSVPAEGTGRMALRRLLGRIRTQRDEWSRREPAVGQGRVGVENTISERGSPSNVEWQQASSLEEGTVDTSVAENNSKLSEDSIVSGPVLQPDDQNIEMDRRAREEELKRQQQEQFALLQELEEKRRRLELQLEEAQLCRQRLQDALQVPSGMCSLQEMPTPPPPPQEMVSKPSPEVKASAALSDSMHIQRLQEYQQRLLKQNRLHKKTIDDACLSLEEYKQALKMRYAPVSMAAGQSQPPPRSANEETVCSFPSLPHGTLSTAITHLSNKDAGSPTPRETPAASKKQSHNVVVCPDPTLLVQPPLPGPSPARTTQPDTHAQPISAPISISHSRLVQEDGLASIPQPADSSSLDKRFSDGTSELQEVPLLPPAVFLEYLRSRRSPAPPAHLTPISQQVSTDRGVVLQEEVENRGPCWDSAMEKNQQVRDRIRKHRDALHALLREQHAKSVSLGTQDFSAVMDAHVTDYKKSNEPLPVSTTPSQSHAHTQQTPVFESSASPVSAEHLRFESASGGVRVNPPVSCPPRTLQILLQDFEQHKLSTIEEVDTPVNVTMQDTAAEVCVESSSAECSDYSTSGSLSLTPAAVGSESSQGPSLGSVVMRSEDSTRGPSKLSWREMLQLESAASRAGTDSTGQQQVEELEQVLPNDGASGVPDFLSSTTLSTGSYFSSEHDPNFNIADSSLYSNEFPVRPGASLACCGGSLFETKDSSRCSNSLQHIINKYTKELDKSLRSVYTGGSVSEVTAPENWNAILSFCAEQNTDPGTLAAPQLPTLPLQCSLQDSNSLNTTMQDTFQSLSPEITNNDTTECSTTLRLPLNPPVEDSNTNTDTTASDRLDCGFSQHGSSTDDQSSSASAGVPQWEWTLGNNSELRNLEASVSHEEVSRLQNLGEVTISTLPQESFDETEMSQSTDRSCSQLGEVEHRRELHSCQDASAKNREKAKEFRTKTLEKLRAKQIIRIPV
ncbi:centrosomal protein of 295 kDa isoform X5 [Ictalurus punctatus]|uniref:Centrosomal protein of 295 kDa isoform X5 n=1 Tax=Ictalurus punctatus TaxID=7998 RepID=A0A2D0RLH1_ICTPU|nr:centrosomal protein of 295 kDa isoform X5 [Ictalurus punctatus]